MKTTTQQSKNYNAQKQQSTTSRLLFDADAYRQGMANLHPHLPDHYVSPYFVAFRDSPKDEDEDTLRFNQELSQAQWSARVAALTDLGRALGAVATRGDATVAQLPENAVYQHAMSRYDDLLRHYRQQTFNLYEQKLKQQQSDRTFAQRQALAEQKAANDAQHQERQKMLEVATSRQTDSNSDESQHQQTTGLIEKPNIAPNLQKSTIRTHSSSPWLK